LRAWRGLRKILRGDEGKKNRERGWKGRQGRGVFRPPKRRKGMAEGGGRACVPSKRGVRGRTRRGREKYANRKRVKEEGGGDSGGEGVAKKERNAATSGNLGGRSVLPSECRVRARSGKEGSLKREEKANDP